MHALVVADGDVAEAGALDSAWPGWSDGVSLVVAADGGLRNAHRLGLAPDILVGDLDSLDPGAVAAAERAGTPVLRSPVDKDETDTELALLEAIRRGATRITVLGALGGSRVDHELANVWLLAHPGLEGATVLLLDARSRVSLARAPGPTGQPVVVDLPGPVGSLVSLFPVGGDADGITTRGLRYPLHGESLRTGPARGQSNVRTASDAGLTLARGRLLVVETASAVTGLSSGS
jgi:thiamine pyrophosphokinase